MWKEEKRSRWSGLEMASFHSIVEALLEHAQKDLESLLELFNT